MNPAVDDSARCAVHPLQAAVGTCARCGNFMCEACRAGSAHCPSCRALVGDAAFPFSRDNWTFSGLWDLTWPRFQAQWVNLSVAMLILVGAAFGVNMVGSAVQAALGAVMPQDSTSGIALVLVVNVVTGIVGALVRGLLDLGFVQMCLLAIRGQPVEVGMVFGGVPQLGRYIVVTLLTVAIFMPLVLVLGVAGGVAYLGRDSPAVIALAIGVASVVAVVALGYLSVPLTFASRELIFDTRASPTEVLRRSFMLVNGTFWNAFGVIFVARLVAGVGVIACCIGVIPSSAFAELLLTGLYLALRTGSTLPPPAAT